MPDQTTDIGDLSEKILKGVQKAVSELIEANAAKGEDMVIGNEDGSFKIVPAKDLLPPQASDKV
jgi:hypothetical protein